MVNDQVRVVSLTWVTARWAVCFRTHKKALTGVSAGQGLDFGCPRQDSNLRTRLRRPLLYPLSYGGVFVAVGVARGDG